MRLCDDPDDIMEDDVVSLCFRLVSYRYPRRPIQITTSTGIRDWSEVLSGDAHLW